MSERDLLTKLKDIYRVSVCPDAFGKRDALPSEVQRVINQGYGDCQFPRDLDIYAPTTRDILVKGDERRTGE